MSVISYYHPEPLSVYRDGERIEDQAVFTTVNRLSRNITLRCLGHAPSNVIDIVWISEREGDEPVTLQPNENDNYTVVTYAYNEANLTISNALEPYRGTLRCQSLASGRQASFYVVESKCWDYNSRIINAKKFTFPLLLLNNNFVLLITVVTIFQVLEQLVALVFNGRNTGGTTSEREGLGMGKGGVRGERGEEWEG